MLHSGRLHFQTFCPWWHPSKEATLSHETLCPTTLQSCTPQLITRSTARRGQWQEGNHIWAVAPEDIANIRVGCGVQSRLCTP